MNAIILYDEFYSAAKAKATLQRAAQRAGETTRWNVKPWRVNLLTLTVMADAALNDATDAHLIMIALRQSEPSATWPPAWLEQWAARRQIQDAALAVWTGLNGGTLSATATPDLSRFAERHGLSFISDDGVPAGNESAVVPRSLHEPHGGSDPALAHVLEQPLDDSYQHWGLNE